MAASEMEVMTALLTQDERRTLMAATDGATSDGPRPPESIRPGGDRDYVAPRDRGGHPGPRPRRSGTARPRSVRPLDLLEERLHDGSVANGLV